MGWRSRRVSARRVLSVGGAVSALPWTVVLAGYGLVEGEPAAALIGVALAAVILAVPLSVPRGGFPVIAGGIAFVLLVLGTLAAWGGGLVLAPCAVAFALAAVPGSSTAWRLGRLAAVVGGVLAAVAVVGGVAVVVQDIRDEPDLEVRLRTASAVELSAFADRAIEDPHVSSAGWGGSQVVDVELVEGLTPIMRERVAAALRRDPRVASVRVVD